ncbi:MAG: topoisomerase IV [Ruminococcaceae bacterium]|nr:topoisomerase IV [Oscillospiraceae bacterium]
MAKKRVEKEHIASGVTAEITDQLITDTIRTNFMPYAMYVIRDRAIPEIDGFKPSHRKLLYTMYKMGLMTGPRTKSANVVGQTMRLNPHGDAAIYETMVRLTRGNESLLHPFVDSKGSFGKQYSRDMAYAASRYTEVKLDPFCAELFRGIDKNAVDMVDNYDATMKEPTLLPTTFPNVLISPNLGIAVGMTSNICSFNLAEICDGTIQLLRRPETPTEKMMDIIKAPDFPGGAQLIYDRDTMRQIMETGRGSVTLRSRYSYDKKDNCIDITQIPYSTSIELIMNRISDLVKEGKLREITDFRDEIDLSGFKLTLDLKRGVEPDKLMAKLFKITPLEDNFSCNFNVLIDGTPRQMGVIELLREWIKFRMECVRRELSFELQKKKDKLHLLIGLGKILLDIDKAIRIVRETELEADVVPNLMEGFGIDEIQAEYIAEIKLRYLNREYIINRIREIEDLQKEIAELEAKIGDDVKVKEHIANELRDIKKKYAKPRKTQLIYEDDIVEIEPEDEVDNYNVRVYLTKEGYFKKITPQSLRGSSEQKLKEGDAILIEQDAENIAELLFFSEKGQCFKFKLSEFENMKASDLGEYMPAKMENERVVTMAVLTEYKESAFMLFAFENGKAVRIPIGAYQTKTNRRKLTGAFSDASPIVAAIYLPEPASVLFVDESHRGMILDSELIPEKTTRTSAGVQIINLKKNQKLMEARIGFEIANAKKYTKSKIPSTPSLLEEYDIDKQQIRFDG